MSTRETDSTSTTQNASTEPILRTENVRKEFGNLVAVDGVSLEFYDDEIVGIIGPNGAGKTTYTNLISGALSLTDGTIVFDGDDISDLRKYKRVRRGLVRSFQIPQIYDELTVFENVQSSVLSRKQENNRLFSLTHRDTASIEETERLLEMFNLESHADEHTEHLPHGVRKILDVAMSFALRPKLMVLDEPTSGVGSREKNAVMETITDAAVERNIGLIFIEHDMELIRSYSDRIVALHEGRVLDDDDPAAVMNSEAVNQFILEGGV
ncbi:ABC transporter ATP-binding protein [Natronolimnohabitans innermongolicus]|uniref:Branched chain amino acid ABC transporter ATP-binding protein n=1 Tax=Natronolimnohabitans innermongolicus JCM 12255 TaxID=1227499 RepID=L9X375_9EURY|nr:ABC transporter ATP-binding protein [Natronolimnohabitans innermongolicus]ELY55013.1 branched chain amino acid ABC transporter ATP-binding protein [Natronolimnohabitans innermongolicus JCM 12255]